MSDATLNNITTVGISDITESPILSVSSMAVQKIKGLMEEKAVVNHGLRVFVAGGGCSGMQYGMAFEGAPQATDRVFEIDGVKIVVDPVSLPYLQGANIDFVDSLMGGGFRIENPNAVSSCGCGNSFRTSGEAGSETHAHEGGSCGCH